MVKDPSGGPSIRVKRWHDLAPEEAPQVMASQDAFIILNKPENLDVARDIYADIQHRPHNAQPIAQLDEKSWRVVRKAFERHTYVLVSPVRSADKPFDWTTVPMKNGRAF